MNIRTSILFLIILLSSFFVQAQNSPTQYSLNQLDSIFFSYKEKQEFEKLLPYCQESLKKVAKEFGNQDTLYARWLYQTGYAYDYGVQNPDEAMNYYQAALAIQKEKIPKSIACANSLSAIGSLYYFFQSDFNNAQIYYLQAKNLFESILGKKNTSYTSCLSSLGGANFQLGNYTEAEKYFLEEIEINAKMWGKNHIDYANSLNNLAVLYENMGRYQEALELQLSSKNIKEKILGKDDPSYALELDNLATLYQSMGRYEEAEPLCLEARTIYAKTKGTDNADYAIVLSTLGNLYIKMGLYKNAESLFLESKNILEKLYGNKNLDYATSALNLARLYKNMDDYEKARVLYVEAKAIYLELLGKEHPTYAVTLNNLANTYKHLKNYEEAIKLFEEAMLIYAKTTGKKHESYALSIRNLASVYRLLGHYEKAMPLLVEAVKINSVALGRHHSEYGINLCNLAELYLQIQQPDLAWNYSLQAINTSTHLDLNSTISKEWVDKIIAIEGLPYPHISNLFYALDIIYKLLQKEPQKQALICDLVLALIKNSRDKFADGNDKLRMLSLSNEWMIKRLNLIDLQKEKEEAFRVMEQNKSVLLWQASQSKKIAQFSNLPDSLILQEKKLSKIQTKIQIALVEKTEQHERDSLTALLNQTNIDIKQFKSKLEQDFPIYAQLKYQEIKPAIAEIQKSLDTQTAMIEYVIANTSIYVLYIDNQKSELLKLPITKEILGKKIAALQLVLRDYGLIKNNYKLSFVQYTKTAFWFYNNLLAPVLNNKKNIEHLVIIPDGELGILPFETFLIEDAVQGTYLFSNLQYLIRDYRISYNYSATLFSDFQQKKNQKNKQNNGNILAMASNYEIQIDSNRIKKIRLPTQLELRNNLSPLPSAITEVKTLSKLFHGDFAFDAMANEANFKQKASQFGIIHLAMHGVLNEKEPLLSSFAFTETLDSNENNFLHAYEIASMELNANLVVLSACETGLGKFEQGNGIASLARSFMYAGVPALIVSLWEVNDFATSEIMSDLYNNLSTGMTKSEALRQAKLSYLNNFKGETLHPAFWSPFILIGDDTPIDIAKKANYWWWILGAILLILIALIGNKKLKNVKR